MSDYMSRVRARESEDLSKNADIAKIVSRTITEMFEEKIFEALQRESRERRNDETYGRT